MDKIAQARGISRSEMLRLIAQEKIPLGQIDKETLILGKSLSISN
ncbi:hypothetical protein [Nostoc sp. CHAB 5715]